MASMEKPERLVGKPDKSWVSCPQIMRFHKGLAEQSQIGVLPQKWQTCYNAGLAPNWSAAFSG